MKHIHHNMIQEWIKDTSRVVERQSAFDQKWCRDPNPAWHPDFKYRFKPAEPKYIVVNGIQVPEPVREPLEAMQPYWLAETNAGNPSGLDWYGTAHHRRWLSLGLIHLTREAAQQHIDAMLLPSRTDK